jgi:hypothetical protein
MTPPSLDSILEDLYAIDPALRGHEAQLRPLVEMLLKNNPGQTPDAAFVEELRGKLRQHAVALTERRHSRSSFFSFSTMNPFSAAIGGAVVAAVVLVPGLLLIPGLSGPDTSVPPTGGTPLFSYAVTPVGDNAFGNLAEGSMVASGRGQGGGGGGNVAMDAATTAPAPAVAESDASNKMMAGGTADRMMIAPEITEYDYSFAGELPALDAEVGVLKRKKNISSVSLSSMLGSMNMGMIDLSSFGDAKLDNVNFFQDKNKGYSISINLKEGHVGINQYWPRWPHPESECRDEACYQRLRVKISELPSEEATIAIANTFLKDHGVDASLYGAPEVDMQWKTEYDRQTDKSQAWVPDQMRVIYPQLVEGKTTYEEYGGKAGLSVGVSVREKQVVDVWGLMSQSYDRSQYAGVTDKATVTNYLANFEKFINKEGMPASTKYKTVKVALGTPTTGYVKMYKQDGQEGFDIYVPALVFPVESVEGNEPFYRQAITVPLAKELLEERLKQQQGIGGGEPMPIPRPLIAE